MHLNFFGFYFSFLFLNFFFQNETHREFIYKRNYLGHCRKETQVNDGERRQWIRIAIDLIVRLGEDDRSQGTVPFAHIVVEDVGVRSFGHQRLGLRRIKHDPIAEKWQWQEKSQQQIAKQLQLIHQVRLPICKWVERSRGNIKYIYFKIKQWNVWLAKWSALHTCKRGYRGSIPGEAKKFSEEK